MKGISIVPDTDFYFETDYPVFENLGKVFVMEIYSNDNISICHELGSDSPATYNTRNFVFLGWLKNVKKDYPEYLV